MSDVERIRTAADELRRLVACLPGDESVRHDIEAVLREIQAGLVRVLGPRPPAGRGDGARGRILAYLQERPGQWVHGEELRAVSGIGEWARRVRELRVQDGWPIEEEGGNYRLNAVEPDGGAADRWRVSNEIRRRPGSARQRIASYLEKYVGEIVARDELDYVARIKEGSRRVRELRDEEGWPIDSYIDDSDLKPGEYRLVSADPADRRDPRQRLYPEKLRERIFARDHYRCRSCGRDRALAEAAGDSRFYLEIHHRLAVADELDKLAVDALNDEANLLTYCHACHRRETAEFQRIQRERRSSG